MTEAEIKSFFMVTEKNMDSYMKSRNLFSDEQIDENPEALIVEILKSTYGYPITFFDSGKEDNFTLTEEKSLKIYESFASEIADGEYEDLYDFTQELTASLPTD